ncbi:MAG: zinc ribbon domain-containing protein [Pseudomonadota bacterium]
MNFIYEWFQSSRITQSQAQADSASQRSTDAARRVQALEAEVETLSLALMAMWELVGKSNGLFMKDLERKMQEIDLRDGVADGRMTRASVDCPSCGRRVGDGRKSCLYCGATIVKPLGDPSNHRLG